MGSYFPLATQICDRYLDGILKGKRAYLDENRIFGHHMYNYLQAYLDFNENRKGQLIRNDFERYFKEAGIYVAKKGEYYTIISLKKGGVVKLFKDSENLYNDTGFIGRLNDNTIVVSHLMDENEISVGNTIIVKGNFSKIKYHQPTVFKYIIFRLFLIVFGMVPHISKITRRILQNLLIVGKKKVPIEYKREFIFDDGLTIIDSIRMKGKVYFKDLSIGTDHTSIYTAVSNCYQESVLNQCIDLNPYLEELKSNRKVSIRRQVK